MEQHDDKSAIELLNLMPEAFLWTVESRTPDLVTLSYQPDPNFDPTSMEARVMGADERDADGDGSGASHQVVRGVD